jgi:hypothetical protein
MLDTCFIPARNYLISIRAKALFRCTVLKAQNMMRKYVCPSAYFIYEST